MNLRVKVKLCCPNAVILSQSSSACIENKSHSTTILKPDRYWIKSDIFETFKNLMILLHKQIINNKICYRNVTKIYTDFTVGK